jgi:hypothetical protein
MPDVTQILSRIETGDPSASEHLLPLVYEESPVKAELVKFRYFAGLSHQQLGLSRAAADRYWPYARSFLYAALQGDQN